MAITISERRIHDVTILEVRGRVVYYDDAALLRAQIDDLLGQARLKFLLDLHDVTFLDSFGVGVIAAKYLSARRKGGDLKLLRPSARSHRALSTAGLMRILNSFDDEEEALRSFHSNART
jgi:anti-sigma B factor antagonist